MATRTSIPLQELQYLNVWDWAVLDEFYSKYTKELDEMVSSFESDRLSSNLEPAEIFWPLLRSVLPIYLKHPYPRAAAVRIAAIDRWLESISSTLAAPTLAHWRIEVRTTAAAIHTIMSERARSFESLDRAESILEEAVHNGWLDRELSVYQRVSILCHRAQAIVEYSWAPTYKAYRKAVELLEEYLSDETQLQSPRGTTGPAPLDNLASLTLLVQSHNRSRIDPAIERVSTVMLAMSLTELSCLEQNRCHNESGIAHIERALELFDRCFEPHARSFLRMTALCLHERALFLASVDRENSPHRLPGIERQRALQQLAEELVGADHPITVCTVYPFADFWNVGNRPSDELVALLERAHEALKRSGVLTETPGHLAWLSVESAICRHLERDTSMVPQVIERRIAAIPRSVRPDEPEIPVQWLLFNLRDLALFHPTDSLKYVAQFMEYVEQGRLDCTMEDDPALCGFLRNTAATVYSRLNDYQKALQESTLAGHSYSLAPELSASFLADWHSNHAVLLFRTKQLDSAIEHLEHQVRLLQLSPHSSNGVAIPPLNSIISVSLMLFKTESDPTRKAAHGERLRAAFERIDSIRASGATGHSQHDLVASEMRFFSNRALYYKYVEHNYDAAVKNNCLAIECILSNKIWALPKTECEAQLLRFCHRATKIAAQRINDYVGHETCNQLLRLLDQCSQPSSDGTRTLLGFGTLRNQALVMQRVYRFDDAVALLRQYSTRARKTTRKDDNDYLSLSLDLVLLLGRLGRRDEALSILVELMAAGRISTAVQIELAHKLTNQVAIPWAPSIHAIFPQEFRSLVLTSMMLWSSRCEPNLLQSLPWELLSMVLAQVSATPHYAVMTLPSFNPLNDPDTEQPVSGCSSTSGTAIDSMDTSTSEPIDHERHQSASGCFEAEAEYLSQLAHQLVIARVPGASQLNLARLADFSYAVADASLRSLGRHIGLETIEFDKQLTCILGIDDDFSLHVTYQPAHDKIFLYAPVLGDLPSDPAMRRKLYGEFLQLGLLGGSLMGGGTSTTLLCCIAPIHSSFDSNVTLLRRYRSRIHPGARACALLVQVPTSITAILSRASDGIHHTRRVAAQVGLKDTGSSDRGSGSAV